jgi:hypothetical protein
MEVFMLSSTSRARVCLLFLVALFILPFELDSRAFSDADGDGMDDDEEMQLAQLFFPSLHFKSGEDCANPDPLVVIFRARPLSYNGVFHPEYVAIHYVVLYEQDCGFNGHVGDNEAFIVFLFNNGSQWLYQGISATAHWGEGDWEGQTTSSGGQLWVSENKHGNYVEFSRCGYGPAFDDCEQNGAARSYWLFNAGEPNAPITNSLGTIYPPWSLEYVWDGTRFGDAGIIREQLYLNYARYMVRSQPPEADACYADCAAQYDWCMQNSQGGNYEQCAYEQYGCSNACGYYIRWDQ